MELNIEYIFILCVLYINDIGDDLMVRQFGAVDLVR